jgi:hypothetical protein
MAANVITAAVIATDAIDADAIKADAVTKIQAGLATSVELATHDGKLDGLIVTVGVAGLGLSDLGGMSTAGLAEFMTVDTGETTAAAGSVAKIAQGAAGGNVTVGSMTAAALAQFASVDTTETTTVDGSVAKLSQGGVIITPLSSTVSAGVVSDSNILAYQFAAFAGYTWVIVDSEGEPVDLSGKSIVLQAYDPNDVATQLWTETGSVGGDDNNQVTINGDDSNTGEAGAFRYVMRNTTDDSVIAKGVLTIVALPDVS